MKFTCLFLFILVTCLIAEAQSCDENYVLDWADYVTTSGGYPAGSFSETMTESDANPSSVDVDLSVSGNTAALVTAISSSAAPFALDIPFVTGLFYQNTASFIIAVEMTQFGVGDEICTTLDFSEPVLDLAFTLFDIDANTTAQAGADREEVVTIIGTIVGGTSVLPVLTSSASNSVNNATGTATGLLQADNTSTDGDVGVTFNEAVISVSICFSVQNIVGVPSINTEPGYGLHNLSFCTRLIAFPVELVYFEGQSYRDNAIELTWSTATETNNDRYDIQRSKNGDKWNQIGTVTGNGTTSESSEYNFVDEHPKQEINYYRLKQVDFDGKFEYSNIVQVMVNYSEPIMIYPNPLKAEKLLTIEGLKGRLVEVYNAKGEKEAIVHKQQTDTEIKLNLGHLSSGYYLIKVGENQSIPLIILE